MLGLRCVVLGLLASALAAAASVEALPEHARPDPFGDIVAVDRCPSCAWQKSVALEAARGGYVSFHLVVKLPERGDYSVSLEFEKDSGIELDVFREWFHLTDRDRSYYPDALIPVRFPYRSSMPEPDNRIEKQTAQAFWIDLWIPRDTRSGVYKGKSTLRSAAGNAELPVEIRILSAVVPDRDVITMDHNSYGSSWLASQYPALQRRFGNRFFSSDKFFRLIHSYHRIFYEHRGTFHQLGYGHAGKVGPEFAPALEGTGKRKHVAGWDLFDRHYGALFDGSAFTGTRRGPRPIPFVYLPINPEWPASFLWWGEPGYEAEFVSVVSEMERHFRQKGWTQTRMEVFFNHKKRYMGFSWDGDEVRFPKDDAYFLEYGRLLRKAIPASTPVRFVFRADVSWSMEEQFRKLAGVVTMWVASGGILSWYPEAPAMLHKRGDIVWYYSGPPEVSKPASTITRFPLQGWLWGVDGFIHWLAVDPGPDPWFHFNGGATALVYPGERFGVESPLASVRLKIQRNCVQDLALLESFKEQRGLAGLRREAAQRYNKSTPEQWWNPRPAFADQPPYEWTGSDIDRATAATDRILERLEPDAWQRVRQFVLQLASEEK